MRLFILFLTLLLARVTFADPPASTKVRKLHLKKDEIALVKTSVGIATIIQVPDRPTSVVLGDTNAFKVEYLDSAITLKPMSHSSKSNLYIYTDGRRFNVTLVTVAVPSADYIVYLEPEATTVDPSRERWRDFRAVKKNRDFSVSVNRLGKSGELLLIAFQLSALKPLVIKPEWLWLTQNGRTVAIQDLSLSGLAVTEKTPVTGFIAIRTQDLRWSESVLLEVRSNSPIKIRLPEVKSWLK